MRDNSNFWFCVGDNLFVWLCLFCIAYAEVWWRNILLFLFRCILPERCSNGLWGSDVLVFIEFDLDLWSSSS